MIDPRTAIAFIGGGNMASAIIGGLLKQGLPASRITVVDTNAEARQRLSDSHGVVAHAAVGPFLRDFPIVVWAIKPQTFKDAAQSAAPFVNGALHLSVAAGISTDSLQRWLGSERIVRSMPNTPALIGKGVTGLYARAGVSAQDRAQVAHIASVMGEFVWVEQEHLLDAVTALSGSGPAYVFYLLEAMTATGVELGLTAEQAHQLAVETFLGAGALAKASQEPPEVLRQRVTSKGGTTHAAITVMEEGGLKALFDQALKAAARRSAELGAEFGKD
ncbi:pyrroline-5-carboxylate reductase [Hylemonella gracilis]|uniref:Pyrroline-5-carboxylate reductase n=1 Tax=Hylemonella gracilis ATCC 19624 TaxID=887062 RepID=F3KTQ0_9BURK|nr:pyrroline-5-carboxylate reductase [Hylemonella gracilis]EGI76929.1 pyrroline-5-carboxylate reductase [Hylemonella gracilis ATCC 19624]